MTFRNLLLVSLLTCSLPACGGEADGDGAADGSSAGAGGVAEAVEQAVSGPEADAGKTDEQIAEEASQADTAGLEATIAQYKQAIAGKKAELKDLKGDLEAQLAKSAGDVMDLLGGDTTKADELDADLQALKDRVASLETELDQLKSHLSIYADELASR